jgi:uncharacterized protein with FMN-binding domain
MKKRPFLIISGTVMGTVGVLSYIPTSTQALAPLQTPNVAPAPTAQSQVQTGASASASNGASKAAGKAARLAQTHKKKTVNQKSSRKAKAKTTSTSTTTTGMRTIAGSTVQTQFGPVQVQIRVQGSKIIRVRALQTPRGGLSSQINWQAVPYLIQQTLAAQSANVQGVSGATYTSEGWVRSLSSAMAKI